MATSHDLTSDEVALDRVSQAVVLDNIKVSLRLARKELQADLRSYAVDGTAPSLQDYLAASGREVADVYRFGSWTALQRAAGLMNPSGGPGEEALLRRVAALVHVDDRERASVHAALAAPSGPAYDDLTDREQRSARMLFFALWPGRGGFASYDAGLRHLRAHPAVVSEVQQLMAGAAERARHVAHPLGPALSHLPVLTHATYRREELLAGFGHANLGRGAAGHVGGVQWCEEEGVDALLINLSKDARSFTPTTMYRDHALSASLFHWESQNRTATASAVGQRYVHHREQGSYVVLFARPAPTDELGTASYLCLGAADHVSHRGERPMAITWRMHRAMPADVLAAASAASA